MQAIGWIESLYRIERELTASKLDASQRLVERKARAGSVVQGFFDWVKREKLNALPRSPLGKALQYADNQRQALERFLEDGRLRPQAIATPTLSDGRLKPWVGRSDTDNGCEYWVERETESAHERYGLAYSLWTVHDGALCQPDGQVASPRMDEVAGWFVAREAAPKHRLSRRRALIVEDSFVAKGQGLILAPEFLPALLTTTGQPGPDDAAKHQVPRGTEVFIIST